MGTDADTLPDALPRFTVKATIEVTLKGGGKREYAKAVAFSMQKNKLKK